MLAGQDDAGKRIQDWFTQAIASSKLPQREIAEMLHLPQSAISKIRLGNRSLGAAELLTLHEQLGVPLPELGFRKTTPKASTQIEHGDNFRQLFDLAFRQVDEIESKKPPFERMDQYRKLETVFYVLQSLQHSPPE